MPGRHFSAGNVQDYYNRRNERAVADFDTPNYLTTSVNWGLPFGKGKPFFNHSAMADALVGGWQLNGIANYHSGAPLGLTVSSNTADNFGTSLRPNYIGGTVTTPGSVESKLNDYFNVSAFGAPAPYTLGNTGRLLPYLRGPSAFGLDISIFKDIPIRERLHAEFRAEAFNILNHPDI